MALMSKRTLVSAIAALALSPILVFVPAIAQTGPGKYSVKGVDTKANSKYSGTVTVTQTGPSTWKVVWRIGGETWNGHGIGDGKIIAINYSGGGFTGVGLVVAKDGGGYDGIWSGTGDTVVGTEIWAPAQ